MTILSNDRDYIQDWIITPIGYYRHNEKYGCNINIFMYKSIDTIRDNLGLIIDKIREDLGDDIANTIDEVAVIETNEIDNIFIGIRYSGDKFAFSPIEL
jgi:hypothetical protein